MSSLKSTAINPTDKDDVVRRLPPQEQPALHPPVAGSGGQHMQGECLAAIRKVALVLKIDVFKAGPAAYLPRFCAIAKGGRSQRYLSKQVGTTGANGIGIVVCHNRYRHREIIELMGCIRLPGGDRYEFAASGDFGV
ncbi:hypothetical protein MCOR25_008199 [Pyricularia grisea]|nr:hypothetical protein MCOR25_008199 [Pyricularia grisea]